MKKLISIFIHPFASHAAPQRRIALGDGWHAIEVTEGVSIFAREGKAVKPVGSISRCWGHATPRHHAELSWELPTN